MYIYTNYKKLNTRLKSTSYTNETFLFSDILHCLNSIVWLFDTSIQQRRLIIYPAQNILRHRFCQYSLLHLHEFHNNDVIPSHLQPF